jgi:multiple sugar transport system permease protein
MLRGRLISGFSVHAALVTLAALFVAPFVWMVLASWKTADEAGRGLFPAIPTFRARADPDRPLKLLGVELRTADLRVRKFPLTHTFDYDFSKSRAPIVLTFDLATDLSADQLHKLAITFQPDESWHAFDTTLELGGRRFVSDRRSYFAQSTPTTFLFQPPTDDDATLKMKTWTPLRVESIGRVVPGRLTLTLIPSGTGRAIFAKATRNYDRVFRSMPFWTYVGNSLILVGLNVSGMVLSSTFVGYAFARLHWPGRGVAMLVLLSTMMVPAQVTMAPTFMIVRSLGWYNTLAPLWVPAWLGSAFFIFLMVQHLKTLPRELEEAARIDGLGHLRTWFHIILPQCGPAAAAIAILTFMASWNDFMGPLVYLRDQTLYPLSLGLYDLQLTAMNDQSVIMAGNVLMTLPVLVIFFLCQRYFVAGMSMSGMK